MTDERRALAPLPAETSVSAEDGTRLYVRCRGWGPEAVVLCDGILCDGFVYKHLWQHLGASAEAPRASFGVVHWNYRGHGRSADPQDPTRVGVSNHVADLVAICGSLRLSSVVLVGHSFGVSIVLEAAGATELPVRGAILIGGTAGSVTHSFRGNTTLSSMIPRLRQAVEEHPRLARGVWSRLPARLASRVALLTGEVNSSSLAKQDIHPYFEHLRRLNPARAVRMLDEATSYSAEPVLPRITVPVLVVAGRRDTFIPSVESRQLAEALANASFAEFDSGTHVCPLEFPKELHEMIDKFLAGVSW